MTIETFMKKFPEMGFSISYVPASEEALWEVNCKCKPGWFSTNSWFSAVGKTLEIALDSIYNSILHKLKTDAKDAQEAIQNYSKKIEELLAE